MANFAQVNDQNIVVYVTVIPEEFFTNEQNVEDENIAIEHLYATIPESVGDRWIRSSYNGEFRLNPANLGFTYREDLDAFIPEKPANFNSWILNEQTGQWEAPIPRPEIDFETNLRYVWDEDLLNWVPIYV